MVRATKPVPITSSFHPFNVLPRPWRPLGLYCRNCFGSLSSVTLSRRFIQFRLCSHTLFCKVKGKAIPVTGRGGPQGCDTSRIIHFPDNRYIYGGEVVSLTRRPVALYPQEDSWYSFLLEAEWTSQHLHSLHGLV
jgi:hypothetical protein